MSEDCPNTTSGLSADDIAIVAAVILIVSDGLGIWSLLKAREEKAQEATTTPNRSNQSNKTSRSNRSSKTSRSNISSKRSRSNISSKTSKTSRLSRSSKKKR